jgi:hypothetical protein
MSPSKTPKQAHTMAGAANNPAFARKLGIPQTVARDFVAADAGKPRAKAGVKAKAKPKAKPRGKPGTGLMGL